MIAGRGALLVRAAWLLMLMALVGNCQKAGPALPTLGTLGEFSLSSQAGEPFGTTNLRGKVWVAAFMFTRCPVVCPRMMRFMRSLQDQAKARKIPLALVSFSVDPDNDTPEVLRDFARKYQVDLATWTFLTGNYEVVQRTSVEGFKLALDGKADSEKADFGILHGSHLVLVDGEMRIRGYYSTSEESASEQLLGDATRLTQSP